MPKSRVMVDNLRVWITSPWWAVAGQAARWAVTAYAAVVLIVA